MWSNCEQFSHHIVLSRSTRRNTNYKFIHLKCAVLHTAVVGLCASHYHLQPISIYMCSVCLTFRKENPPRKSMPGAEKGGAQHHGTAAKK